MGEFVEVMKQKERMCKSYKGVCRKCDVSSDNNGKHIGCRSFTLNYPQEAEEIIMKWAEEHPVQTNVDKFKEVFGFEFRKTCVISSDCIDCKYYRMEKCEEVWWNEEYKEPSEV